MANEIDPQQFEDLNKNLEELIKTLGGTTTKSEGLAKTLGDQLGLSKKVQQGLSGLGTSATDLTKSLYKGEQGAAVFSNALESAADAITILILAIPGLGVAAKLATVAMNLFAKGVGAAAKQGDALYKTYQELQRSGATAADGIDGVFNNMQRFGYGIADLDKMVRLVAENSQTLAKFSLTAADGTTAFASAMTTLVRDQGLKELGKMPEDINAAGAAFIRQTVRAGMSQRDVGDQLTNQTKRYIMDLDRLQRLTGTSADALQKQQDEAMTEDAYNDVVAELRQRSIAGDNVATEQLKKILTVDASLSAEMQKEFRRSIGGDISAGQKLFIRYPTLIRNIQDETVSLGQTMADSKKDVDTFIDSFGRSYRYNAEGMREFGGALYTAREEALQFGEFDEKNAAAANNAAVTNTATKNLAKINLEQMNSRDALQSFVQLGVAPATEALAGLADVATGVSRMVPGQGIGGQNSFGNKLDQYNNANKSLLDIIGQGESKGNYNALVYGKKGVNTPTSANLTDMTIAQVMEYQKGMIAKGHASTAVGKYQMIAETLADQVKQAGLDVNSTKFDKKTQDLLAQQLINQAGYGRLDPAVVMRNLAGTWASLPKDMSSGGAYDGFNGNRASISPQQLMSAISGPAGGYNSKMSTVNPDSTLANAKDPTAAQVPTSTTTQSDELLSIVKDAMLSLDRKMGDVADNTKSMKQAANR